MQNQQEKTSRHGQIPSHSPAKGLSEKVPPQDLLASHGPLECLRQSEISFKKTSQGPCKAISIGKSEKIFRQDDLPVVSMQGLCARFPFSHPFANSMYKISVRQTRSFKISAQNFLARAFKQSLNDEPNPCRNLRARFLFLQWPPLVSMQNQPVRNLCQNFFATCPKSS